MLAQQMQLANAMMPGAPLQPVVSLFASLVIKCVTPMLGFSVRVMVALVQVTQGTVLVA